MNTGIYGEATLRAKMEAANVKELNIMETKNGHLFMMIGEERAWVADKDKEAFKKGSVSIDDLMTGYADYEDAEGNEATSLNVYTSGKVIGKLTL